MSDQPAGQRETAREPRNDTQLAAVAGGVAYRCEQLAGCAMLVGRPNAPVTFGRYDDGWSPELTFVNAVVESALINARALAYFIGGGGRGDADVRDFERVRRQPGPALVPDAERRLARTAIIGPVSAHLAHIAYDRRVDADRPAVHPGRWPITEIAVVLVDTVARAVDELEPTYADWFMPDPRFYSTLLVSLRDRRTLRSGNRAVGGLTRQLQAFLDGRPVAEYASDIDPGEVQSGERKT